ncbi:hypothetical protein FRX31_002869 [Thalictrum thalictroides]|uniref:Uncharacterized protein n=1 Tax=Thalictrum thalictroides TaxID=46969 RepID=A0A7J6XCT6_THATH|nr:hypothetical protein FRX31_002869 [Thalictrum thalictroides]
MVNARFQAMVPRRVLAQAENKSFQIEWLCQTAIGEEVELVERSRSGTFMAKISVEGGRWLGALLCQISMGTTILGVVEANGRGDFLRFVIFNRSANKFRTLCFPAGFKGQAWSLIGSQVRKVLEKEQVLKGDYQPTTSFYQNQLQQPRDDRFGPSFAEVVEGGGKNRQGNSDGKMVDIPSKMSMNASWWAPVVIIKSNHSNPDWSWVTMKVQRLFSQAIFRFPNQSEAIVELRSEKEVDSILSLPPLTN